MADSIGRLLSASTEYGRVMPLLKCVATSAATKQGEVRARALHETLLKQLQLGLRHVLEVESLSAVADVLRAFVEIDASEQAESWLRTEWVMPRMLPDLQAAAEADDPLTALIGRVGDCLRSKAFSPLLLPEVLVLPIHVLSNILWAELCRFITTRMAQVFGAGIPSAFHMAYSRLTALQLQFEQLLPSARERRFLRNHAATAELWRKFNLPIYFQLRVQVKM